MSVARDPSGNEVCLRVDAACSLYTAAGALLMGTMQQSLFSPGDEWIQVNGQTVDATKYPELSAAMSKAGITKLPDMSYTWVKAK